MINQKTFNIFFSFLFIFLMSMIFIEKNNIPADYQEDIQRSLIVTKNEIVLDLKKTLGTIIKESGTYGTRNNLKHHMRYILLFVRPNSLKTKKELIKSIGWIEYTKMYQEKEISTFCKDKFQLILTLESDSLFVEVIYDRLSPCWKLEEKLKSDTFSLVQ